MAKLARAKKHLIELQEAIATFAAPQPYTVTTTIEGKKKRRGDRLAFTADPANTDIPIIAADVAYNLRSCLDHLMSALVDPNERTHVYFPIYFQGVWEVGMPGEDQERRKQRGRWASDTATVKDGAVAILQKLQPPDRGEPREDNLLRVINTIANADRHTKLPVVAQGLRSIVVRWSHPINGVQMGGGFPNAGEMIENQAQLRGIPYTATDVQAVGEVVVAVRCRIDGGNPQYVEIPESFTRLVRAIEGDPSRRLPGIIAELAPFVR